MGDFRFNLKASVVGHDGEEKVLDWWLNWSEDIPARVYNALADAAQEVGLPSPIERLPTGGSSG